MSVLRDAQAVIAYIAETPAGTTEVSRFWAQQVVPRPEIREHVAPMVAAIVAEIAVLDRETDARALTNVYAPMIARTVGWEEEPWRAVALWLDTASQHLDAFATAWAAHLDRAERRSESTHRHVHLVDLEALSATLSLTRPRIRNIFPNGRCSLDPVRLRDSAFTSEERRQIKELARLMGVSYDHLSGLAQDPVAFSDRALRHELAVLREAELAPHRGLVAQNDALLTKALCDGRFRLTRKPGPKADPKSLNRQVEELAREKRVAPSTIWKWIKDGACNAPITSNNIDADGYTETEAQITRIAMTVPRRSKRRSAMDPAVVDLLTRWKTATTGKAPASTAWIRQTKARHKNLDGLIITARQWEADNGFLVREQRVDAVYETYALKRTFDAEPLASARPVSGFPDPARPGSLPTPEAIPEAPDADG